MKKKIGLLIAPLFIASFLASCGVNNPTQDDDPKIREVYAAYVAAQEAKGEKALSYDEWLASIKGEKGDPGKDGKDGVDGKDGKDGVDGKDGKDGVDGKDGEDLTVEPFTVTFEARNGEEPVEVEMDHIGRVAKPADPTRFGYEFIGWYTTDGEPWVFSKDVVAEDTTLLAQWKVAYSASVNILSTTGDSEFSVFTGSDWRGHAGTSWNAGCTFNMSWRTIAVFDAEGRLAYGVSMGANGYGTPSADSYMHDPVYDDYTQNPAIVMGEEGAWDLVVPEGGFAVTSHTNGANALIGMLSYGLVSEVGDGVLPRINNKQFLRYNDSANVRFGIVDGKVIRVEDKDTAFEYHTFTAGGAAVEGIQPVGVTNGAYRYVTNLTAWRYTVLVIDGVAVTHANSTVKGAVRDVVGGADWTVRLYDEDGYGKFWTSTGGDYAVEYNIAKQELQVGICNKLFYLQGTEGKATDAVDGVYSIPVTHLNQWGRFSSIIATDAEGNMDVVTTDTATITGDYGPYGTAHCLYVDGNEDHGTFLCWEADGIDVKADYTMATKTFNITRVESN